MLQSKFCMRSAHTGEMLRNTDLKSEDTLKHPCFSTIIGFTEIILTVTNFTCN